MFQSLANRVRQAQQDSSFHFAPLLPEQIIRDAFGEASQVERKGTIYRLPVVVWMFLAQVLCPDHSCRTTVARLIAWLAGQGLGGCSSETGSYCIARGKLDEAGCHKLLTSTAQAIDDQAQPDWLWKGHRVRIVDGTTVTMPDTPWNQQDYPQQSAQAPGCGQPIMRMVVLFSLATGVALEFVSGAFEARRSLSLRHCGTTKSTQPQTLLNCSVKDGVQKLICAASRPTCKWSTFAARNQSAVATKCECTCWPITSFAGRWLTVLKHRKYMAVNLVIIDEFGYQPLTREESHLFFRVVNYRYAKGSSTTITTNKGIASWPSVLADDEVLAGAILDRLLHSATVLNIQGRSYRLKELDVQIGKQSATKTFRQEEVVSDA